VVLLYIAGHETTVNLIGNGMLALLRHRDQLELLQRDTSLDPTFVDELLRYDSPVQMSRRITLEPYTIGDKTLDAGLIVMTALGSANRDPAKWGPTADDFRIDRDASDHVAFGSGVHLCLGASLARLEAKVATEMLLAATDDLTAAGDPTPTSNPILRGLVCQPVGVVPK